MDEGIDCPRQSVDQGAHTMDSPSGPASPRRSASPDTAQQHQIAFLRNGHTWRLQWSDGDEMTLLDTLAVMASDPDYPLDDFDRALVNQQMNPDQKADRS